MSAAAKLFTPSSNDLMSMIAAAEAKCDRDIAHRQEQAVLKAEQEVRANANERAERAFRINAQIIRARREHDVRRHMNAGDRA
jgi:hypothetical protein